MATSAGRDVANFPQFQKQPFRCDPDVESSAPHQVSDEADRYGGTVGYLSLTPLAISAHDGQHGSAATGVALDMDKHWGTAFKVNVVITIISAVYFGTQALKLSAENVGSGAARRRLIESSGDDVDLGLDLVTFLLGIAVMIALAVLITVGMLHSLVKCGRGILYSAYYLCAAYMAFLAFGLADNLHSIVAIVPAALCVFIVVMIRRWRSRFEFGAANLKVAATALKAMPWAIHSAVLMILLQILWCFVAGIAAYGSFVSLESVTAPDGTSYPAISCTYNGGALYAGDPDNLRAEMLNAGCICNGTKISDGECDSSGLGLPLMIIWLVSLSWGCVVIHNVVAATVVGSVASWWFTPNEDAAPVRGAFHRATHSSFGSLCKAAVVLSAVHAVAGLLRRALRCVPCVGCLLSEAQRAVNYILSYTICFIGVYGLNFSDAGKRVYELFSRRGVTTVANDVIVSVGLGLLAFCATFAYFLIGLSLILFVVSELHIMDTISFWSFVLPVIFGFVTCVLFISTALEVVMSGYKAVFVCYVQDPEALAENHDPELHSGLYTAWEKMQTDGARMTVVLPDRSRYSQVDVN